jgi:hypothetical protein
MHSTGLTNEDRIGKPSGNFVVKARKFAAGMKTCFSVMHGLEFVGIILNGMLHSHSYPISVEVLFVWMTLNA